MRILENISLKTYNTFSIDAIARYFVSVETVEELKEVLAMPKYANPFILSGGSNMLLKRNINNLVIHINLKGIEEVATTENKVSLKCMAGENWHEFVLYCIENDYGGLENMSLIPGNVGTSPIQNIGAYGVELKNCFVSCSALEIATSTMHTFTNEECNFGYRASIFKTSHKDQFIITDVTFNLSKKTHTLHTSYGAIQNQLTENNIDKPTIKDVSNAVIAIRKSKLPDPKELGNSGSFFKNPIINKAQFEAFNIKFPEAPFYNISKKEYKIPAGWLIEQSGFKGKRYGDAGVHKNQALVLVNYGNATGENIWQLALKIQAKVFKDFGIEITPEVNIIS